MKKVLRLVTFFMISFLLVGNTSITQSLLAQEYNLKPLFDQYGMSIRNQEKRNTCSVFAIIF